MRLKVVTAFAILTGVKCQCHATQLLMGEEQGAFLVRPSVSQPGSITLSVVDGDAVSITTVFGLYETLCEQIFLLTVLKQFNHYIVEPLTNGSVRFDASKAGQTRTLEYSSLTELIIEWMRPCADSSRPILTRFAARRRSRLIINFDCPQHKRVKE